MNSANTIAVNYFVIPLLKGRLIEPVKWYDPEVICDAICRHYCCTMDDLRKRNNKKEIVAIRHKLVYLLYEYTDLTYEGIGDIVYRDYSGLIIACQKVKSDMTLYPLFKLEITELKYRICLVDLEYSKHRASLSFYHH